MSRPNSYDPFKDPHIHLRPEPPGAPSGDRPPTHDQLTGLPQLSRDDRDFIGRPDHLAQLPWTHPASLEEEALQPYRSRPYGTPGKPIRINWGEAAALLAQGTSVASTASLLSCDEKRIWRNLRRSRKFRTRIEIAAERLKLQADLRFRDLSIHTALQMKHRAAKLDSKTLHWLAERLRMGMVPEKAESLAGWLEAIAAPAGPSRKRRAKSAVATGLNGTQQDSTGFNGTKLALNGIELASNGTELAPNGLQLASIAAAPRSTLLDKPLGRL